MPSPLLQALGPLSIRVFTISAVALSLGGCLGRGTAETTGSLASRQAAVSETALRGSADDLGKRFDAEPGNPAVAIAYSRTLRDLGQRAQAVAVLQQAAIRNPQSMPLMSAYGKALADAGRLKEAADALSRAHTPERPDWRVLSALGAIADQTGDFEGAQRYYETALRIAPGEPSVLSNQGLSFALAKRLKEGEIILRQAANDPRADARVRQNLALVLGLEGKLAEAEEVLRRDMPPAEAQKTLASIRRMVSQPNSWKALRQAETPASHKPANPKAAAAAPATDPQGSRYAEPSSARAGSAT